MTEQSPITPEQIDLVAGKHIADVCDELGAQVFQLVTHETVKDALLLCRDGLPCHFAFTVRPTRLTTAERRGAFTVYIRNNLRDYLFAITSEQHYKWTFDTQYLSTGHLFLGLQKRPEPSNEAPKIEEPKHHKACTLL